MSTEYKGNIDEFKKKVKMLSPRQIEIVSVILLYDLNNNEIAASLYLAEKTVRSYISDIYKKVGVKKRVELVRLLKELYYYPIANFYSPSKSTIT